jgi:hypothetical protein
MLKRFRAFRCASQERRSRGFSLSFFNYLLDETLKVLAFRLFDFESDKGSGELVWNLVFAFHQRQLDGTTPLKRQKNPARRPSSEST